MAEHAQLTTDTGCPVYFCDPRSPWQRGTNENMNRLLRQYLSKNADLRTHDQAALDAIAARLNGRPRRVLGWRTPAEAYVAPQTETPPEAPPLRHADLSGRCVDHLSAPSSSTLLAQRRNQLAPRAQQARRAGVADLGDHPHRPSLQLRSLPPGRGPCHDHNLAWMTWARPARGSTPTPPTNRPSYDRVSSITGVGPARATARERWRQVFRRGLRF